MKPSLSFLLLVLSTTIQAGDHSISHSRHHEQRRSPAFKHGYKATFFEPFADNAGSLPSSKNWLFDLGTSYPGGAPRWGNNEFQTYTALTSNIQVSKSNTLRITPRLTKNGTWTSARIETQRSDFAAVAGGKLYIESRIKLGDAPRELQHGIWPAFWALGSSFRGNYTNWPAASEWDFLEVLNGIPTMHSTLHCGVAPGGPCNEYDGLGNGGVDFELGSYHTVAFEVDRSMTGPGRNATWRDESLNWYVDDKLVHEITGARIDDKAAWEKSAHEGHFLLLNVAVGGNWPGPPNNATIDGPKVAMEVDYVAVFNSS